MSTGGADKRKLEKETGKQSWFDFSPPPGGFREAMAHAKYLSLRLGSSTSATWPHDVHLLHCLYTEEGDICTCMEPQPVASIFTKKPKHTESAMPGLVTVSSSGGTSGPSSSTFTVAGPSLEGSGSGSGSGVPAVSAPCCPPLAPPQRAPLLHALCALWGACCSALTLCPPLPPLLCPTRVLPPPSAAGASAHLLLPRLCSSSSALLWQLWRLLWLWLWLWPWLWLWLWLLCSSSSAPLCVGAQEPEDAQGGHCCWPEGRGRG